MGKVAHKLLLFMTMLALAVTPLRGGSAFSIPAEIEAGIQCEQMSHDGQAPGMLHGEHATHHMQQKETNSMQDCDGSCCDDSCSACAQGTSSITNTALATEGFPSFIPSVTALTGFSKHYLSPPYRPPVVLH